MPATHLSSQQITHVIHLADLHIRCGDAIIARIEEYTCVFDNFIAEISLLPCVINKTALCLIAGDICESKCRAETASSIMLFKFINQLQQLVPIIFICGNHDFKQSEPNTPDSVEMFTIPYDKNRVMYLKETGCYIYGNLGFGVVSVKDTLRKYNTAGVVDQLEPFPEPIFPNDVTCSIALFHGTIKQSALSSGRNSDIITHGYPLEWFDGYNMVMLGDNHMQQVHTTIDGMMWAYSGSMLQQNWGETLFGHGYILWDIAAKSTSIHHIRNDYGMVIVSDACISLSPIKKVPFKEAISLPGFPKYPKVRIIGDQDDAEIYERLFKKLGIEPSSITIRCTSAIPTVASTEQTLEQLSAQMDTLGDLNSAKYWHTYMNSQENPMADIEEWIYTPESMQLPITSNVQVIKDSINARNAKIQDLLQAYDACANSTGTHTHRITLKYMEWDNLMAFGGDNRFDFESMEGKIALLNGPNASGKSSFLDVLCIAIFGEPTASRRDFTGAGNITAKLINDHRNNKENNQYYNEVILVFDLDHSKYEIHRRFEFHHQDKENIKPVIICVYKYQTTNVTLGEEKVVVAEGSTMVNEWVDKYFGTAENMLMSTILCQSDTTNFFFKKPAEQKALLDKALNLDTIASYVNVIEESVRAHKYMIDKIQSYRQGMSANAIVNPYTPDDLIALQTASELFKTQQRELSAKRDTLLSNIGNLKNAKDLARKYTNRAKVTQDLNDAVVELAEIKSTMNGDRDIDDHGDGHVEDKEDGEDGEDVNELRNNLIRYQVEQEALIKKGINPNTTESYKKGRVTRLTKDLNAHNDTKPIYKDTLRFSRKYIKERLDKHAEWIDSTADIAANADKNKNIDVKSLKEAHAKLLAHNIGKCDESPNPNPKDKTKDKTKDKNKNKEKTGDITLEKAIEKYTTLRDAMTIHTNKCPANTIAKHSSAYYNSIISKYKSWEAEQPTDWLNSTTLNTIITDLRERIASRDAEIYNHTINAIPVPPSDLPKIRNIEDCHIEITKASLDSLMKPIACKTKAQLNQWYKTWNEWETDILKQLPAADSKTLADIVQFKKLTTEIGELGSIECNPECAVCLKNPGIVRKKTLEKQLAKLTKAIGSKSLTMYVNADTLEKHIQIRRMYDERHE